MNTINELDPVTLTRDVPAQGLKRGDVGTAVLVHASATIDTTAALPDRAKRALAH